MNQKPQPLYAPRDRKHCPVCGQVSYSAVGIHPQCAVHQADEKRMQGVKARSNASKEPAAPPVMQRWQKACPSCRALMHVRKKLCDCGHAFVASNSQ